MFRCRVYLVLSCRHNYNEMIFSISFIVRLAVLPRFAFYFFSYSFPVRSTPLSHSWPFISLRVFIWFGTFRSNFAYYVYYYVKFKVSNISPLPYKMGIWSVAKRVFVLMPTNSGEPRRDATHSSGKCFDLKANANAPSCNRKTQSSLFSILGDGVVKFGICLYAWVQSCIRTNCWMTCSTNSRNE